MRKRLGVYGLAAVLFGCGNDGGGGPSAGACGPPTGGGILQPFAAPCDPGPGEILIAASGEVLALGGYGFPPADGDQVSFVDGWEVRFTRVLVTFDHVTLSENPDLSPTDQSRTGAAVARVDGPWAVDLHKGGPLAGKGGAGEQAVPIATLRGENLRGGAPFDDMQRYAFGFETIPATPAAKNVNLDAEALADYQDMIDRGYVLLVVGQATFRGTSCSSTLSSYDFGHLPTSVDFRFGFRIPAQYINCQNADNDPAPPFPQEAHQRGLFVMRNAPTVAQVTFHTDHTYWQSMLHDSPLHFDQIAARFGGSAGLPLATMESFVGVAFTPFQDRLGADLPWRACLDTYRPPGMGAMAFDTLGVPVNPNAAPDVALRDYLDYMAYNTSTFGHLNGEDGLCYVKRNYASPP